MIEGNNGESLSQPTSREPKRHNAKLCPFAIRQRIVNALANGDSKRAIARALRVSNNTVTAVAEQEWRQVEARKTRIAAQCEAVATKAFDQLNDRLDADTLPPNMLVPIAGVATDKLLALRAGDTNSNLMTIHYEMNLRANQHIAEMCARIDRLRAEYGGEPMPAEPSAMGEHAQGLPVLLNMVNADALHDKLRAWAAEIEARPSRNGRDGEDKSESAG